MSLTQNPGFFHTFLSFITKETTILPPMRCLRQLSSKEITPRLCYNWKCYRLNTDEDLKVNARWKPSLRAEINVGDFLKSILNVGDFLRKFKCRNYIINTGDSRPILKNWKCMT